MYAIRTSPIWCEGLKGTLSYWAGFAPLQECLLGKSEAQLLASMRELILAMFWERRGKQPELRDLNNHDFCDATLTLLHSIISVSHLVVERQEDSITEGDVLLSVSTGAGTPVWVLTPL